MTRPLPCGTSLQNISTSWAHTFFMGYWKSMFSEKRISSSNSVTRQLVVSLSRWF
jgi:hypothetical protein